MSGANGVASYRVERGIAVLTIDAPPVNALSHKVRIALCDGVARALADDAAEALVLICAGRTFFAGADVTELGRPIEPPLLADVMGQFEASAKPIVSALHGTALGGGFELALAGHYRVAVPSAVVGLPEVALGLLPGAGGTQRVPRLVGVAAALDLIGLGRKVRAQEALKLGLIDAVVDEGELESQAISFARRLVDGKAPLRRVRDLPTDLDLQAARKLFDAFREAHPELFVGLKAAEGVLQAIKAAIALPFDAGLDREREISRALIAGPESAAQRHLFFAERTAAKLPGNEREKAPPIQAVAISGQRPEAAGLRAAGLDVAAAPTPGLPVVFAEDLDFDSYRTAILDHAGAPVIVATGHVSALDELAAGLPDPAALVGLSLVEGMAEIVVGRQTRPAAALTALAMAQRAGWPAIFVTPCPGLVLARLRARFGDVMARLLADGVRPADVAAAGRAFGFADRLLPQAAGDGRTNERLQRQLTYPVMAEALQILRDGIALRGSDVDYAMVRAGLWPLWRGGPIFEAERIGADVIGGWMAEQGAGVLETE